MNTKRIFDLTAALPGLLALSPLFLAVATCIKREDGGKVFFRQERIGRKGTPFYIWKFRTMVENAERLGTSITIGEDSRITKVGRFLRKYKLDELPQLINVLWGEMSLVGPRPEVPKYVALYDEAQKQVLELMPGITDPASIKYHDESTLLAAYADPTAAYIADIMPDKIQINLQYAKGATCWSDFKIIFKTLGILS